MSEIAQVNWNDLKETHRGPTQTDKGDKKLKIPDRVRGAENRRRAINRLQIDRKLGAENRINEYDAILNKLIAESLGGPEAAEKIKKIWENNRMLLQRGGALGIDAISIILQKLVTERVVTPEESLALLEEAKEEKNRRLITEPTIWDMTVSHELDHADPPQESNDTIPEPTETSLSVSDPIEIQITELISQPWFRDESLRFIMRRIAGTHRNQATVRTIADDIYQNFAEKVLKKIHLIRPEKLQAYLKTILIREMSEYFRKESIRKTAQNQSIEGAKKSDSILNTSIEQREEKLSREIIKYLVGEITNHNGEGFGYSHPPLSPQVAERYKKIILGRLRGEDFMVTAQAIAKTDMDFSRRYLDALSTPNPSVSDPQVKRLASYMYKVYERGLERAQKELGIIKDA